MLFILAFLCKKWIYGVWALRSRGKQWPRWWSFENRPEPPCCGCSGRGCRRSRCVELCRHWEKIFWIVTVLAGMDMFDHNDEVATIPQAWITKIQILVNMMTMMTMIIAMSNLVPLSLALLRPLPLSGTVKPELLIVLCFDNNNNKTNNNKNNNNSAKRKTQRIFAAKPNQPGMSRCWSQHNNKNNWNPQSRGKKDEPCIWRRRPLHNRLLHLFSFDSRVFQLCSNHNHASQLINLVGEFKTFSFSFQEFFLYSWWV